VHAPLAELAHLLRAAARLALLLLLIRVPLQHREILSQRRELLRDLVLLLRELLDLLLEMALVEVSDPVERKKRGSSAPEYIALENWSLCLSMPQCVWVAEESGLT